VEYDYVDEGGPFYITYTHEFKYDDQKTTYFAFTYPFSFEEIQNQSAEIIEKYKNNDTIYVQREVLGRSLEGRPMDMLTISSRHKMTYEREELIDGLFPCHPINSDGADGTERPFKFDK
jgi:cytosolic carboxypeptidase protein 5